MRSLVLTRALSTASLAVERLRALLWPITQSAVAAGIAWYLAHNVLGHAQPFFAPIAAAVCLWVTDVVRAQLAAEMMFGVALGIGVGTVVHSLLGGGPTAIATGVLLALCAAVLVGQGFLLHRPMFVNQATTSTVLVLAFPRDGLGTERLFDALIGGGLAVAFSILLFPRNPIAVLRNARADVVAGVRDLLAQVDDLAGGAARMNRDWTLTAAELLRPQLLRLGEARNVAGQLVRAAPRRWPMRQAVRTADQQAVLLTRLGESVVHLGYAVTIVGNLGEQLDRPVSTAISDLAEAGRALAANKPDLAAAHTTSVRRQSGVPPPSIAITAQALIDALIDSCADDFQQVIGLGWP